MGRRPQLVPCEGRLEILQHVLGGGVARRGLAREQLADDRLELRGIAGDDRGGRRRRAMNDLLHDREVVVAAKRPPPDGELEHHHAEREQIAPAIESLAAALLGRHVRCLALERSGLGLVLAIVGARDPEIEELDRAVVADEHVARRDVAVDEPERPAIGAGLFVRALERGGGALDDRERDGERDPLVALARRHADRADVLAVDVLHREEQGAVDLADIVDVADVRVPQRGGEPGFIEEHLHELGIRGEVRQDPLQHDHLLEAGLTADAREVDLRHPAGRDLAEDLVFSQRRPARDLVRRGRGLHWQLAV